VSLDQSREGGLRAVLDVVLQEFVVIHVNASIRLWPPRAEIRQDFQRCVVLAPSHRDLAAIYLGGDCDPKGGWRGSQP
jgi:hypothetical protein